MAILKCIDEKNVSLILEYIGSEYRKVPYLYSNLVRYGVSNENVETWIDYPDSNIKGIYLRYFDCIHFFTKELDYSIQTFLSFIQEINPNVIFLEGLFGEKIKFLNETNKNEVIEIADYIQNYQITKEFLYFNSSEIVNVMMIKSKYVVQLAKRDELLEITELLLSDDIFSLVYSKEMLHNQLLDRFEEGYGVFFIVKEISNNKIVAGVGINSENEKFIFHGGVITDSYHRQQGLAKRLLSEVVEYANKKGKYNMAYILEDNIASQKLHESVGFVSIGEMYKLIKDKGIESS